MSTSVTIASASARRARRELLAQALLGARSA